MRPPSQSHLAPWADTLPADWGCTRLDAVADVMFSNVDKHTKDGELPVRLCNYVDVYRHDQITGDIAFMEATAEEREIERFQLRRDDVLVTKDSETADDIAIAALVRDELPGVICGYHLALIRARSRRVTGPFLAWLHASKSFRAQYEAKAVGVTRFGLSQHAFRELIVPVPPLLEQDAIVAYLRESCDAIDEAILRKRKQLETLTALESAIIFQLTTQGLDPNVKMTASQLDWLPRVPASWRVQQIKRRCELLRGKFSHRPRNDPAFYDGPYPFVQTGDITAADKFIRGHSQTLNEAGLGVSRMFPKGTLVMSIAANVGDVAILDFEACFPDSMIGLIPYHDTDLEYLYYLCRAMKDVLLRSAVLTTQLNLNYVSIGTNYAAFPSREEQATIAAEIDRRVARMRSVKDLLLKQVDALVACRNALIHECVTGQYRIVESMLGNGNAYAAR